MVTYRRIYGKITWADCKQTEINSHAAQRSSRGFSTTATLLFINLASLTTGEHTMFTYWKWAAGRLKPDGKGSFS